MRDARPGTEAAPAFGTLLRRYRVAAGLTQEELAERAGVSRRSVSDLERGVPHRPRKDTLALLTEALQLAPPARRAFCDAAQRAGAASPLPAATALLSAPPFVGRERELALLERHLAGEGPPLLLLAGEPGIGKTRLLHATIPRAVGYGLRVLEGGCQRQGGQEPYAPLLGALRSYLRRQRPAQLRVELQGCAWLVRLLPELASGPIEPLPSWTLPPEQEQRLMGEAVLRLLANVAGPGGTLLVLDDLQWAGADALALLTRLARSAAEVPLRILGAHRDTEVRAGEPLANMVADLAHAGLASRRVLAPLAPAEAAQLLDALLAEEQDLTPALRERVVQRTGGVPFFLLSCAQDLQQREEGARVELVPWAVTQSVRQRVAALPEGTREVLGVAAVVGRVVPHAVLVAACDHPALEVATALQAACEARLLEEAGAHAYQFAHDVIREVVELDLGAARRLLLHGRVGQALERAGPLPADVEALAYHYSHSGEQDKAALYLERAGDNAGARYAHAAAAGYYHEALVRLDRQGDALPAARVRERLGAVLLAAGQYDQALEVLEQAAETYRTAGDLNSQGQALMTLAYTHTARGTPEEPVGRVKQMLAVLEERGAWRGATALCIALANLFYHPPGRLAEHLAVTERAVQYARTLGDDRLLAVATKERAAALFKAGRWHEALPAHEEAARLAETAGDLNSACFCLQTAAGILCHWGEVERQRAYSDRAVAIAERLGDPLVLVMMLAIRGVLAYLSGDWVGARADYERAVRVGSLDDTRLDLDLPTVAVRRLQEAEAEDMGLVRRTLPRGLHVASAPLLYLGQLCLAKGDLSEAARHLEDAAATAAQHCDIQAAQSLLAQLDLLRARPADAYARLVPLTASPEPWEWWEFPVTPLRVLLAWAQLELGEVEQAAALAAQAVARARAVPSQRALVEALWIQARVAIWQQHWTDARHALDEGIDLVRRIQAPYAEGRLLHVAGQLHAAQGEGESAHACWAEALAIFQRLGARADAAAVERALRTLPSAPPPDT